MTAKHSVLAIADDPTTRAALQAQLIARVGDLKLVASSVEARHLLRSWQPTLIIWRIRMPTPDDISLARAVYELPLLVDRLAFLR